MDLLNVIRLGPAMAGLRYSLGVAYGIFGMDALHDMPLPHGKRHSSHASTATLLRLDTGRRLKPVCSPLKQSCPRAGSRSVSERGD